ncbi:hydroxyisourate hydrolase [Nocardioides cavernaquae]|uniref:5-hydroxyisourate hydrolase n=1 Tax=Nocardioides cavernaquae TaxID=2321396 RepID=A0A3A5HEW5_9ACTN|nr:hydroxyisourate hydrolase [Nocardioides cavernaquae]RJS46584.1 hydroxyisourate hydrolase [Nocardioides cavernaquae]
MTPDQNASHSADQNAGRSTPATISTHVLDAALGRPAADLPLTLTDPDGTAHPLSTDADGRARLPDGAAPGIWTLTFETGPWFAAQDRATFYPSIEVCFEVVAGEHHHVALLLSPFAYTTYRGS